MQSATVTIRPMSRTATHAPEVNLATAAVTNTMADRTAPRPLKTMLRRQWA